MFYQLTILGPVANFGHNPVSSKWECCDWTNFYENIPLCNSNNSADATSKVNPASSSENADKNSNIAMVSPTHYAVPKAAATKIRIQLVPDFHQGKHDMGELLFHCQKVRIFGEDRYVFFQN